MKFNYILILIFSMLIFSCSRDEDDDHGTPEDEWYLKEFISLTTDHDTLRAGASTKITAVVDSEGPVLFIWHATLGDILGYGSTVTYVAPACACGDNKITCKARQKFKELTKTVTITVID